MAALSGSCEVLGRRSVSLTCGPQKAAREERAGATSAVDGRGMATVRKRGAREWEEWAREVSALFISFVKDFLSSKQNPFQIKLILKLCLNISEFKNL